MFDSKSNKALFNILSIVILFITFNNVSSSALKYIGLSSILFILGISSLILSFVFIKNLSFIKNKISIVITYILMILIFSLGTILNFSMRGFVTLSQLILIVNFFLLYSTLNYKKESINFKIIFITLSSYLLIYYIGLFKLGFNINNYKSIYSNPNTLGLTSFLLVGLSINMYLLNKNKLYIIYGVLFFYMMYLSNTRSSMLALFLVVFTYFFYKLMSINKFTWRLSICLIIMSIIFITYIYPSIDQLSGFSRWNSIIYEFTGKTIYSGRNMIWRQSMEYILERPLFGYGTGVQLADISNVEVSTHNLYIQVLLQNGIVGFAIFMFLITSIWKIFYKNRSDAVVKFNACFFIGIIYQNMFEVTLLQNNMALAIMQWFIISMGVSRSLDMNKL